MLDLRRNERCHERAVVGARPLQLQECTQASRGWVAGSLASTYLPSSRLEPFHLVPRKPSVIRHLHASLRGRGRAAFSFTRDTAHHHVATPLLRQVRFAFVCVRM